MKTLEHYITASETPVFSLDELKYWVRATITTRTWGHTYIHKDKRGIDFCHDHPTEGDIVFMWGSYGRSLAGGGHRYKVRAVYVSTGKPVPTKILKSL